MATSSNKRHSVLPSVLQAGPKAPVKFSSTIVIADSAILTGVDAITIGSDSVVHPRAKLESKGGGVNVGRRCIISERSHIGASASDFEADDPPKVSTVTTLEDFVTVEVGAVVEAGGTILGEGSTIGAGVRIGKGAMVGKYCIITAMSIVAAGERVPDMTVVHSNGSHRKDRRRDAVELRQKFQTRQIEVLRRLIPSNPAKFQ